MPNHCSNRLSVDGPQEDVAKFFEFFTEDGKFSFDTQRWLPMPEAMEGIKKGSTLIDGVRHTKWREVDGKAVAISQQELELIRKQCNGHDNWYDWHAAQVGTKWGAYESYREGNYIRYQTAWSPLSNECIAKLSQRFPALKMTFEYAERGMCFFGVEVFAGGANIESVEGSCEFEDTFKPIDEHGNDTDNEEEVYGYRYIGDERFKELFESSG